ncbi:MAG: low specificity L-threonine aldolase [Bacteroidales bacterium]|nr:low specificity L-threonine aldolase [Bacteroidales bacterium]
MKSFASDNWAGTSPEIMDALINANQGHSPAYGADPYTEEAKQEFKKLFGKKAETYFVYNGTAANIISLASNSRSFNSIICSSHAHINVDECGAGEKFAGTKLLDIANTDGKLTPEMILPHIKADRYPHQSVPGIISITQATELGTLYSVSEIKILADLAHKYKLLLHVDGARIANAAVALNCSMKEMITDTGVDILSFGGTKNGLMFGEAVVFLKPELADLFELFRKQGMQLASKMRFISVQFTALLKNNLWEKNARQANEMAQYLGAKLARIPEIKITQRIETNGIWAIIPKKLAEKMQQAQFFYPWDEAKDEYRIMTAYDTSKEEIDLFIETILS